MVHAYMEWTWLCMRLTVFSPKARSHTHACLLLRGWQIVGSDEDFFSQLVVDAIQSVKSEDIFTGKIKYPVKAINILKAHGKSARESCLLNGYALNLARAAQGMPKSVKNAKIACLDMNLQKTRMMMGVQVRTLGLAAASSACAALFRCWNATQLAAHTCTWCSSPVEGWG